ncbi:MAG: hypothetical protein CM1200mP35_03820 [Chloroflexota bacterium]|nr:MAG: hypothetical protein CM1200mP35_03820 [Chloroflexota bacterium]
MVRYPCSIFWPRLLSRGKSIGETALSALGLTGIPIINVEKSMFKWFNCFLASILGSNYWNVRFGLAFGAEKVPSGPVTVTASESPERYIGSDHMMAGYALRMRRYMEEQEQRIVPRTGSSKSPSKRS